MTGRNLDRLFRALEANCDCGSLCFTSEPLNYDDCMRMGRALKANTRLWRLTMTHPVTARGGLDLILGGLEENTGVGSFNLIAPQEEMGAALPKMVLNNKTIETLRLMRMTLVPQHVPALLRAFRANTTLLYVDFSDVIAPVSFFGHLLLSCTRIRILWVERPDFGHTVDDWAVYLAAGLAANTTLRSLIISGCRISLAGARAIAGTLANNRLRKIRVTSCSFEAGGIAALARGLRTNTGLKKAAIDRGDRDTGDSPEMIEAIRSNTRLRSLWLGGVFSEKSIPELTAALEHNTTLEHFSATRNANSGSLRIPGANEFMARNYHARLRRQFRGVCRAVRGLLAAFKRTLVPGGPAFARAKASFEAEAAKK